MFIQCGVISLSSDADHQTELPVPSGLHPGNGVFHDDRARRRHA
jgi:hypothetical protein